MLHDQWKQWVSDRRYQPLKLKNAPLLIKFSKALEESSKKYNVSYLLGESGLTHQYDHVLIYHAGSPNFNMFKLLPGHDYIYKNPFLNLWKECDIDSNILEVFSSMANQRYLEGDKQACTYSDYDLCLMQMEAVIPRDDEVCRKSLNFAKESKTLTLFKSHPSTAVSSKTTWDTYKKEGLVSDYSVFVEDFEFNSVIDGANRIYSSDSAVSFNALLKNKKVATFHEIDLSEVVPIISSHSELDNIESIPDCDRLQFLSWYYHKLSIDVLKPDYQEKIDQTVMLVSKGKTSIEILRCR
jgi:hypothetical protein